MKLEIKRIFDDAEFEVWAFGCWQFTRMSDGSAFWEYVGVEEWTKQSYTRMNSTAHPPRSTRSCSKKKHVA